MPRYPDQPREREPSQLDQLRLRILMLPWWVNFVLGFIFMWVAIPIGLHFGLPVLASMAGGFVAGFALPHYLFDIGAIIGMLVLFWIAWLLVAHYEPDEAADYRHIGHSFVRYFENEPPPDNRTNILTIPARPEQAPPDQAAPQPDERPYNPQPQPDTTPNPWEPPMPPGP